jgi:uncharacterized protein (TIGR03435 family)
MMSVRTVALVCALATLPAFAQSPAFEVVSIKPNREANPRNMRLQVAPGKFTAISTPLLALIRYAYEFPFNPSPRVIGVPDWAIREMFDVEAKAPAGAFPPSLSALEVKARMLPMLRRLLADYFRLDMRVAPKEMAVYALAVAPGGPKMQTSTAEKDCPTELTSETACHSFQGGIGRGLRGKAVSMKDLAGAIENWTDLPVVDRTGLTGLYDFQMEPWAPMALPPPPPDGIPPLRPSGDGDMRDPARPTLFVVLRRLGLDLKRDHGEVETYTVAHLERPPAN